MEEKLATDTIRYLYTLDDYLKINFETGGIKNQLRQNLLQKARMLELKRSVNLPKKTYNSKLKCPKCCMPRDQGLGSYKLCKNRISRFQQKMTKKLETGAVLTKYQEKYLKKRRSQTPQVLEIKCRTCGYKVVKDVVKPNFPKKSKEETNKPEITVTEKIKNEQKSKIGASKSKYTGKHTLNNQPPKKKLNGKILNQQNLSKKPQLNQSSSASHKINKNKLSKMNILLSSTSKIKNTGLKDFIKSIT